MTNKLDEILKKYGINDSYELMNSIKPKSPMELMALGEIINAFNIQSFATRIVLIKSKTIGAGFNSYTLCLIALINESNQIDSYVVGRRYDADFQKSAFIDYYEKGAHYNTLDNALQAFNKEAEIKLS